MYLLIQNQGVAPIEAFTLLGDSGTRGSSTSGLIGQFGSGNKHAINLLLRKGIKFYIYLGKTRLEFFHTTAHVKDANGDVRQTFPVKCRLSGGRNKTIDCGWTLGFGELDWRDTSMAIREFVSNAIDQSKIIGEDEPFVVMEPKRRAKDGYTRVFIDDSNPDVPEFYRDLGKHFLHFSTDPSQVKDQFLRKSPDCMGPRIYREGVFVRELSATCQAAYDYNFEACKIDIDECRNSSEYSLRAAIGMALNKADQDTIAALFSKLSDGKVYEGGLDEYYLSYNQGETQQGNWQEGWKQFAGEAVAATHCDDANPVHEYARGKGYKVAEIHSDAFAAVAGSMGIKTVVSVLGDNAAKGKIECQPTQAAIEAVDTVWAWVEAVEMTAGKPKPGVCGFKQLMDAEGETLGYYTLGGDCVFIREDVGGGLLLKTALEEVGHYVTGATDCSRDFQQYFIDMIVELAQ